MRRGITLMQGTESQEKDRQFLDWSDRQQHDKQILALNALTELARSFSNKPDIHDLLNTVLLTLAGQFSVTNAFVRLVQPGASSTQRLFYATGRFNTEPLLEKLEISESHARYFCEKNRVQLVDELTLSGPSANLTFLLNECGVRLVAPILHDNRLIGILGLGDKVSKKAFDASEFELLTTIINTITPLIVNAFLFHEITELNDWYLQILDNVKQGVFVFDSDRLLKKVNIPGYKILREFRPHLNHIDSLTRISMEVLFPEAIYPGWSRQLIKASVAQEGSLWEKMKAQDGSQERIYRVRVSPVVYETQRTRDIIVTLDDVTVQEENEQRMFDLEKFAEKGMMASSISHELNNFLGMLLGGVELSQMALNKGDAERAGRTLEKIKANIGKMERFTSGLMNYAKLNTEKKKGSINDIVNDVLSFITVQKKFKNITITTELDGNLPEYLIDTDQIAQLLLNMLNNAADTIREIGNESGRIGIRTGKTDGSITLSISDNGAGMKPEVKERLFKSHITTKPSGHGYGLIVCDKIIQNHRGTVSIDTLLGSGTTFTFDFPLTGATSQ